ncbi:MAG: LysR family transcriptional regulator, partial [Pseudomonadota bacterium]|nr:LysR family transcriptional regulator [Pseudomonadota bacterium]
RHAAHSARGAGTVCAVYPQRKYLSPKVRAFIDFFAQRFGPDPYWDRF